MSSAMVVRHELITADNPVVVTNGTVWESDSFTTVAHEGAISLQVECGGTTAATTMELDYLVGPFKYDGSFDQPGVAQDEGEIASAIVIADGSGGTPTEVPVEMFITQVSGMAYAEAGKIRVSAGAASTITILTMTIWLK